MEVCKNCGAQLIIKHTKRTAEQLKKPYYYTSYYWCTRCKKLYHDEKFKVTNKVSHPERLKGVEGSPTLFANELDSRLRGNDKIRSGNDNVVEIWTDGACVHNGTPRAKAAWGFVSGKTEKAGLVDGLQTNNRAEALAIYHGLAWASEKGFRKIRLHTDSQISIHGVSKDPSKVVKNREIFEKIAQVIQGSHLQVEFVKVLGHSGDEQNERVDKVANDFARSS